MSTLECWREKISPSLGHFIVLRGRGGRKLGWQVPSAFAAPGAGEGGRRKGYELLLEPTATRGRRSTSIARVWIPGQTYRL